MPRAFTVPEKEALVAGYAQRRCHCKVCGKIIYPAKPKVTFSRAGSKASFCPKCFLDVALKIIRLEDIMYGWQENM